MRALQLKKRSFPSQSTKKPEREIDIIHNGAQAAQKSGRRPMKTRKRRKYKAFRLNRRQHPGARTKKHPQKRNKNRFRGCFFAKINAKPYAS